MQLQRNLSQQLVLIEAGVHYFNVHIVVVVNGDTQEVKNYRPITFLLTIDKVFEQMLCKQVTVKLNCMFS